MPSPHEEVLAQVFCDVLEKLAFVFAEQMPKDELPASETAHVKAEIGFSGAFKGALRITVPLSLCPVIAANILGKEPDDEAVQSNWEDALRELANVTCGHVLTGIAGSEPVFDLSLPVVQSMPEPDWEDLRASESSVGFVVEDEPVLLALMIER